MFYFVDIINNFDIAVFVRYLSVLVILATISISISISIIVDGNSITTFIYKKHLPLLIYFILITIIE